ncbi:MAG: diol dehydratase reactivase subunit alpha [Synergistaceae bacterium]|jgi:diol dehydratase reactivase alpha subunit|nr:diol dehydratase reactivase subunit alpha [Synergistaceae bacterium]
MAIVAGIDIGNATTETALARIEGRNITFLATGISATTGIKGTLANIAGLRSSLGMALERAGFKRDEYKAVDLIRLNHAAPVIGDVAMETVTETIVTESIMIGHNPSTPGGVGVGIGVTILFSDLSRAREGDSVIPVVEAKHDYEAVAAGVSDALSRKVNVAAVICQSDDGVLIVNRLPRVIPVVDEVSAIERVPLGMRCCVEVAAPGRVVSLLSNPYDIASLFELSPEETKQIVPVARALVGNRSAVVIRTPLGEVRERRIPAGELYILGPQGKRTVNVEDGAEAIQNTIVACSPVENIFGQPGTNVGGMMERVRRTMSDLTDIPVGDIYIQDLLAVDTLVPQKVVGGVAGEFSLESGVALAIMVKTEELPMQRLARATSQELGVEVEVGGIEADMAIRGALTTPGVKPPVAVLDLGAGSSDASFMKTDGSVTLTHLAGAGNMVNTIIASELGFEEMELAEAIKRYPLCKVESAFHIRQEDGTVRFFDKALDPGVFGRVALLHENDMLQPLMLPGINVERVRSTRRKAKQEVFVKNALRALEQVAPGNNIRLVDYVVLVGGSAKDFEIPTMITDTLSRYGIVAGRGNIRSSEGPRNAVATGLVLSSIESGSRTKGGS